MIKLNIRFKDDDFDSRGIIKISSLLKYMQRAAETDADQFGATHENLWKENMFFAVYRNILKIKENITKEDKQITLISFQSFHDRMRFMRSYFIYKNGICWDKSDEKSPYENASVYCDSIWVLMDINKRTLLRATALSYPVEEFTLPFERPFKVIIEKESAIKAGEITGGNYYIDENGHVNNAAYGDIVSDFSSLSNDIKYFDITYEHEILENEKVEILKQSEESGEKLMGVRLSDNAICFCSEIKSDF